MYPVKQDGLECIFSIEVDLQRILIGTISILDGIKKKYWKIPLRGQIDKFTYLAKMESPDNNVRHKEIRDIGKE